MHILVYILNMLPCVYMFMNRNVSVLMILFYVLEKSACSERIVLNSQRSVSMLCARCSLDFCGT
jgi:hypothetical protein